MQAVRLRRAGAEGDASARLAAAREFGEFFRNEERVHLRDEEEELFPLLLRHVSSQPAPLREARLQHAQLQGFARKLEIAVAAGSVDRETLDEAGELLDAHIRLEERQLFPLIDEENVAFARKANSPQLVLGTGDPPDSDRVRLGRAVSEDGA